MGRTNNQCDATALNQNKVRFRVKFAEALAERKPDETDFFKLLSEEKCVVELSPKGTRRVGLQN